METLDNIKQTWQEERGPEKAIHADSFNTIIKHRMKKENRTIIRYFLAAFVYQNVVYGLSAWIIANHPADTLLVTGCVLLSISYLPFTIVLMKRFKQMKGKSANLSSMLQAVEDRYDRVAAFFRFKQKYEWVAVPISCLMITSIVFLLWVPGAIIENQIAFVVIWLTLVSAFVVAIRNENKKQFREPLARLSEIIADLKPDKI